MTLTATNKSTIVRARHRTRTVHSAFAALERLAPAIGARWAERLWFTIPPSGTPRSPEGGEPFEVRSGGHVVRGWTWGRGPVVYLAHGWGGYAGQLAAFVPSLTATGFTVVAHDALSHGASDPGRSGPRASDIVELGQSLDAVAAAHGPAQAVIGHSMGGLGAMLAMRDGWLGTRRLVLVAPMLSAVDFMPVFAGRVGFGPRIQRRLVPRIERRVGATLESFDAETLLAGAYRPPLLAVHDRDDAETPSVATEALVAGWPDAELLATRGLGHRRILRDADVVRSVTDTLIADLAQGVPRSA